MDIDFTLPFTRCRYTVAPRLRYSYIWLRLILVVVSTAATPGEWQCKIRTGGVRRLAVANRPNIFQMLLVWKLNCMPCSLIYCQWPGLSRRRPVCLEQAAGQWDFSTYSQSVYLPPVTENLSVFCLLRWRYIGLIGRDLTSPTVVPEVVYITWTTLNFLDWLIANYDSCWTKTVSKTFVLFCADKVSFKVIDITSRKALVSQFLK